jgi:diguanylate cyclase (GGDEF)-like protein
MLMISMPLPDGGLVVTYEDITERQAAERKIGHLAMHDGLTGLANRTYFRNHIDQWLERHGREDSGAMLFLDLDRFKIVNDTLGHPTGDALLVEVARRIAASVDSSAFAARLGGDEFGIFLSNIGSPNEISIVAERLLARISEPYDIESHHLVIGTSIGVAIAPQDGRNANELSKNADLALYRAKQDGKGQFRFFEPEMDRRMRDWHELEHDLREALVSRQFELYYQPLVNLATSEITAFEALLRWHRPQHGYISPADFIPVAEEAGLMNEIGAWVLKEACDAAADWPSNIKVAVNISPLQFSGNSLANDVLSALTNSQLRPDRLMLEITEGVFLNDTEETMAQLNTLESAGIHFAMDDFGTGYSSLSYLRKFRFDKIKIDQSFVRGLCDNPESEAIVRAVINLCHDLGMETVAEGVETPEQAARLREIGCEIGQGYLFGRPTPRHDAVALLEGARRKIA